MTNKPISPLRQRMIDDMKFRNMSPSTRKGLHLRSGKLQRLSPPITRQAWNRTRAGISASSHGSWAHSLVDQPDHRRVALLLWDHARAEGDCRSDPFGRKEDTLPAVLTQDEVV